MYQKICLLFLISFSLQGIAAEPVLQDILVGKHRSATHQVRDRYRHPEQTLAFFDVQPNMTVVEIWPGGKAWYTEILAPYLKQDGLLYAAHFEESSTIAYYNKSLKQFKLKLAANPEIYGQVITTALDPYSKLKIAPDNSVDRVLTFRNVHNWMRSERAESVFKTLYRALKPGGILGVVQHRNAQTKQDPHALSRYVSEAHVIQLAEQAGFKLLARSEINANPKDTHDHPKGVGSLPPLLSGGKTNRAYYQSIGESDRMTLKFMKP